MSDYDLPDYEDYNEMPSHMKDISDDTYFEQRREEQASVRAEAVTELQRLLLQEFRRTTQDPWDKTSCVKYAAVMGWNELADQMRKDLL